MKLTAEQCRRYGRMIEGVERWLDANFPDSLLGFADRFFTRSIPCVAFACAAASLHGCAFFSPAAPHQAVSYTHAPTPGAGGLPVGGKSGMITAVGAMINIHEKRIVMRPSCADR